MSTSCFHRPIKPLMIPQNCEWRISIYGRSVDEWDKLAKWVVNNKIYSHNVRWLIQVPRLYNLYKANGSISNFQDLIRSMCISFCGVWAQANYVFRYILAAFRSYEGPADTPRASCLLTKGYRLRQCRRRVEN